MKGNGYVKGTCPHCAGGIFMIRYADGNEGDAYECSQSWI